MSAGIHFTVDFHYVSEDSVAQQDDVEEARSWQSVLGSPNPRIYRARPLSVASKAYVHHNGSRAEPSDPSDLIRRRPLLLTRFHMATLSILMWHVVGLVCLFVYWIGCLRWLGFKPNKWMQWNAALEGWWGDRIISLTEFWFNAHFDVEGAELLAPGPVVVFSRYSSVIDTMMPLRLSSITTA